MPGSHGCFLRFRGDIAWRACTRSAAFISAKPRAGGKINIEIRIASMISES